MNWPTPTLADVFKARRAIAPYLPRTPMLEPAGLAAALGCRAVLKCENLNPTGAFKVRGGVNLLASMDPEARARGVVAASTGNHGQSVAYAARLFGTKATIFMPEAANPLKAAATVAMGAEVIRTGRDFDAARLAAEEHAARHGLRYIHSSNEPMLVAGVGHGGAGTARGRARAGCDLRPGGRPAAGCSAPGSWPARSTRRSGSSACRPRAPRPSTDPGARAVASSPRRVTTFAEGLATREPFEMPLALFPRLVDEIMLVDDDQIASAIRLIVETARLVAEGAGAAAVAAAMHRREELAGKTVGLIISGGNITAEQLRRVLNAEQP